MDIRLDGKVALVTGASRGIGLAIARSFAESGARVMLTSRKQEALEEAVAGIAGETAVFAANAGDIEAGEASVQATLERFGGLDILVNNAGTNPFYGRTLGVDPGRYDKTMQVNVRGPLFLISAAYRLAMKEKPGVVLNVASVGGLRTSFGLGIYNVSKAALIHLTRQLASEIGPTRVVGVAPGLVNTEFSKVLVENFGETLAKTSPLGRLGEPEDVAALATFLVSDHASWITGDTFVIDGGAGVRVIE